jgi:hypothetical protein
MSKPAKSNSGKKRTNAVPATPVADAKPAQQTASLSKGAKVDPGSKQSRVIAMFGRQHETGRASSDEFFDLTGRRV